MSNPSSRIYVITGSCGPHWDAQSWPAGASYSRADAEVWAREMEQDVRAWLRENECRTGPERVFRWRQAFWFGLPAGPDGDPPTLPFDGYEVVEVRLRDKETP